MNERNAFMVIAVEYIDRRPRFIMDADSASYTLSLTRCLSGRIYCKLIA